MRRLLLQPWTSGLLALLALTCTALITAIPLIVKDSPASLYVVLLITILVTQSGQVSSVVLGAKALERARQETRMQLGKVAKSTCRGVINDVCATDPLLKARNLDLRWAIRVWGDDDLTLIMDGSTSLIPEERLASISTPVRMISEQAQGRRYGVCRLQVNTGFTFEVFYDLPLDVSQADGAPLGHAIVDAVCSNSSLSLVTRNLKREAA